MGSSREDRKEALFLLSILAEKVNELSETRSLPLHEPPNYETEQLCRRLSKYLNSLTSEEITLAVKLLYLVVWKPVLYDLEIRSPRSYHQPPNEDTPVKGALGHDRFNIKPRSKQPVDLN